MKRLLLACHLPFGITQLCVRGQHATLSMALYIYVIFSPVNTLIFKHNLSTG